MAGVDGLGRLEEPVLVFDATGRKGMDYFDGQ